MKGECRRIFALVKSLAACRLFCFEGGKELDDFGLVEEAYCLELVLRYPCLVHSHITVKLERLRLKAK